MHRIHRTPCREEPPTDDTDAHRCRRVWHPCHTHAAKFCGFCEFRGNKAHPKHLCRSVKSVGEKIFPQNARTEPSGREESPTDEHGCSQIRRVWHPCHTHAAQFCVFCAFRGRTAHHNHLCSSVSSVGEKIFPQNAHTEPSGREEPSTDEHGCSQIRRVWHPCHTHAAQFCGFCGFCGRTAHPNHLCQSVPSVGEKIFPQNARNARNLLAEKSLPQMSTDVHRLGGYGIPAAYPRCQILCIL